jgi:hypothetical protein
MTDDDTFSFRQDASSESSEKHFKESGLTVEETFGFTEIK